MKMLLATIEQRIEISLNAPQKQIALRAVNFALTGKETVPLNINVSKEHKDAHYAVCISDTVTVLVDIYNDGSKKYRIAQ